MRLTTLFLLAFSVMLAITGCFPDEDDDNLALSSVLIPKKTKVPEQGSTLQSITITPNSSTITVGQTHQLSATGSYDKGADTDITSSVIWSSSDDLIATVNASGLVTAVAAGTVTITATSVSGLITGSATITVVGATLQSIDVTPNAPSIPEYQTQQLSATGNYDDLSTADLTVMVTWSSSDELVATVDVNGLVTPLAVGTATITATAPGPITGSAVITVVDRPWVQDAYIKASNTGAGDEFGKSVDIDGDTMVVSARLEASNATGITNDNAAHSGTDTGSADESGAVYVFQKDSDGSVTGTAGHWYQDAYLKASNAKNNDWFGQPVEISGDTIVVGSYYSDFDATGVTNDNNTHSGADAGTNDKYGSVYVFQRDLDGSITGTAGYWYQDAYLKASNAGEQDRFGSYVAIDGTTIVVSANQEDSNASTITNSIGGHSEPSTGLNTGAAYVFKKDLDGSVTGTVGYWYQDAYLKPSNPGDDDIYGVQVAISGTTIAVTSWRDDSDATGITNATNSHSGTDNLASDNYGSLYVYQEDLDGSVTGTIGYWYQDAYIKPSNPGPGDNFFGIAIDGDTIVVGALGEDSNATGITNSDGVHSGSDGGLTDNSGAAYVFKRDGSGNWIQDAYLKAPNSQAGDRFGNSVAISGNIIAVGALFEDSDATGVTNTDGAVSGSDTGLSDDSGAVFVYKRNAVGDWLQDAYLKASNTGAGDYFATLAISGDTIVAGSYLEDSNATGVNNADGAHSDSGTATDSGAVYIFKR